MTHAISKKKRILNGLTLTCPSTLSKRKDSDNITSYFSFHFIYIIMNLIPSTNNMTPPIISP
jgi:hypothetical protein